MPGPSNIRRKRKSKGQKRKPSGNTVPQPSPDSSFSSGTASWRDSPPPAHGEDSSAPSSPSPTGHLLTPSPQPYFHVLHNAYDGDAAARRDALSESPGSAARSRIHDTPGATPYAPCTLTHPRTDALSRQPQPEAKDDDELLPQPPYLHDPGNGIRVRDTRAFLASSFFAQPPALNDPLCAEFAQEEVLQMLSTVLPEDLALVVWYNKSRATSRICPACQRLYRLGDVLPELIDDEQAKEGPRITPPQVNLEQQISGICSSICFILASYSHPGAIQSSWGRMADDIDDESWALLNTEPQINAQGTLSADLSLVLRMTRLHDLGLAQLCLPDVEFAGN